MESRSEIGAHTTVTNDQKFEEIFIKEEPLDATSQDGEFYENVLQSIKKEEACTTDNDKQINKESENSVSNNNDIRKTKNINFKCFCCSICKKGFMGQWNLTRHLKTYSRKNNLILHVEKKDYMCSICRETFTLKSHLEDHMRIHIIIKVYKCTICNKQIANKSSLNKHMRIHAGIKAYECPTCKKSFTLNCTLKKHMKIHTGIKDHTCAICNKRFIGKEPLITHMKSHSGAKDHKCTICNKRFTQRSSLKAHMKIHSGIKDEKCTICHKRFVRRSNLTEHMKIHSRENDKIGTHTTETNDQVVKVYIKEEPLEENLQDGEFHENVSQSIKKRKKCTTDNNKQIDNESENSVTKNNDVRKNKNIDFKYFCCSVCKKGFLEEAILKRHMETHNRINHLNFHEGNMEYKCSICKKSFTLKSHLEDHMEIHNRIREYECTICNKQVTTRCSLYKHMIIHAGIKAYECPTCKKSFPLLISLNRHMKIHSGTKDQKCTICNRQFLLRSNLNRHMKIHSRENDKIGAHTTVINDQVVKEYIKEDLREENIQDGEFHNNVTQSIKNVEECTTDNEKQIDKESENSVSENNDIRENVSQSIPSGKTEFHCYICNKYFTTKRSLKIHFKIHAGIKEYECIVCKKSFVSNSQLIAHSQVHSGIIYECTICNKQFNYKDGLSRHMVTHTGKIQTEKKVDCPTCNKLIRESRLKEHLKTHSGQTCTICSRQFTTKSSLTIHMKIHSENTQYRAGSLSQKLSKLKSALNMITQ